MFASVCSIRSAQCAALIALAAAAGISRFEPATPTEPDPATTAQAAPHAAPKQSVFIYPARVLECFRLLFAGSVSFSSCATSASAISSPSDAAVPETVPPELWFEPTPVVPPLFDLATCATSFPLAPDFNAAGVGQHRFPYAVGPPCRSATSSPRAARTRVPGDSTACRISAARIAPSSVFFARAPSAPFERAIPPRPVVAGSISEPSLTLRGEPSLSPKFPPGFALPASRSVLAPTSPFVVATVARGSSRPTPSRALRALPPEPTRSAPA